jgi:hypothetical protein
MSTPELRDRLTLEGASAADLAWFDAIGWSDAAVSEVQAGEVADYQRREALLNRSVADLTFAERGESLAGRLAAAIGARLADYRDDRAGDDEE